MATIDSEEQSFRLKAKLCMRCGMEPRLDHHALGEICIAEDRTKRLNRELTEMDQLWTQATRAVA